MYLRFLSIFLSLGVLILLIIATHTHKKEIAGYKKLVEVLKEQNKLQEEIIIEQQEKLDAAQAIIKEFNLCGFDKKKYIEVTVTSYNPVPSQGWGNGLKTYSGDMAAPGIISISHDLRTKYGLRMGQKVILGKYGQFIIGDLMNKRFTKKVDIICLIPAWSKKFGVQKAKLYYQI